MRNVKVITALTAGFALPILAEGLNVRQACRKSGFSFKRYALGELLVWCVVMAGHWLLFQWVKDDLRDEDEVANQKR